jgi:hypothetical protein
MRAQYWTEDLLENGSMEDREGGLLLGNIDFWLKDKLI